MALLCAPTTLKRRTIVPQVLLPVAQQQFTVEGEKSEIKINCLKPADRERECRRQNKTGQSLNPINKALIVPV